MKANYIKLFFHDSFDGLGRCVCCDSDVIVGTSSVPLVLSFRQV